MKKKFKVAIIGAGGRGYVYADLMKKRPDEFEVTAVCDFNEAQLVKINKVLCLPENKLFTDEKEFFKEKRADVLVISTWDKSHVSQSITAMELGYDILLEKPVSDSKEEIKELFETQKHTRKKVIVCHVLRYGPGYKKLSYLLNEGVIGKLMAIDATERVVFWHQAQAYVRIQSTVNDICHPTLLAKCSHDLDYIQHYASSKCKTVSSVGGLGFFIPQNAPEGATKRCVDCPHINSCPYSAKIVYIDNWKKDGCPDFIWPYNKVSLKNPNTEEDLYKGIETSHFGKCVFFTGVEENKHVVDNQMVQMQFENGVSATLKMLFAGEPGRRINLFGSHGEIVFDEIPGTIEIKTYGNEKQVVNINDLINEDAGYGHGGGDYGLISDLYSILAGDKTDYTSLEESVECHLIGIAAEESRLNGGITLKVH